MMRAYRKCPACGHQDVSKCPEGSFSLSGKCVCGSKMDIEIGSEPEWFSGKSAADVNKPSSLIAKIRGMLK